MNFKALFKATVIATGTLGFTLIAAVACVSRLPAPPAQATAVVPLVAASLPVQHVAPKPAVSKFSMQDRARWACSDAIKARAVLPDELRWTRRSQWLAVERDPGVWEVHAQFVGRNRMGVDIPDARACTLRYKNDNFYLIKG